MADKTTNEIERLADLGLPGFVRQVREIGSGAEVGDCFDHWAPQDVTGDVESDFGRGWQHCQAAIAFSQQIGTANFLLYVLMSMQGGELRPIERGFISRLIPLALSGRVPPVVPDAVLEEVALTGVDIGALRENEAFMVQALRGSSAMPDLFYRYVLELISGPKDQWIGAAVYLLSGAALNGSQN
jgi:hypothetical protein